MSQSPLWDAPTPRLVHGRVRKGLDVDLAAAPAVPGATVALLRSLADQLDQLERQLRAPDARLSRDVSPPNPPQTVQKSPRCAKMTTMFHRSLTIACDHDPCTRHITTNGALATRARAAHYARGHGWTVTGTGDHYCPDHRPGRVR